MAGRMAKERMENETVTTDQNSYDTLQSRRAEQEWTKVPHVDLEGYERADELADEGVKKHGVRLAAEGKK